MSTEQFPMDHPVRQTRVAKFVRSLTPEQKVELSVFVGATRTFDGAQGFVNALQRELEQWSTCTTRR